MAQTPKQMESSERPDWQRPDRIDIHDDHQVRYWMKELQVDERTLKATVAAAGYSVEAVRTRLKKGRA
jgi:hypothetical protein